MRAPAPLLSERFSIKELEAYSGIKAHTIRMWERRYHLLAPDRTDTNIRNYSIHDLKDLLNVALLVREGEPISRVAALTPSTRSEQIRTLADARSAADEALNALKVAMLTYDEALFERTSAAFRLDHGFDALAERLYLPLLQLIGVLWQANAICSAREHFISNLIRQKLIGALATLPVVTTDTRPLVVLYLPENEIHELGLLYLHYRLRRAGRRTLYLGQSVPVADLEDLAQQWPGALELCAVCTVQPRHDDAGGYAQQLARHLTRADVHVHLTGARAPAEGLPARISHHASITSLADHLLRADQAG